VSAALFAADHIYSIGYCMMAFLSGLILAYCFALQDEPRKAPYLTTCVVHGLRNAIAMLVH